MTWMDLYIVQDTIRTLRDLWKNGWDERNSGNISIRLAKEEVQTISDLNFQSEFIELGLSLKNLAGEYFLISGTGQYFRQAKAKPQAVLGIIKINENGSSYQILAGFEGGKPTSELPTHLLGHHVRKDKGDHIILHCHPTSVLILSAVLPYDEKVWSYALWNACTESVVVFPEGVGILPWMVCGSISIGEATAEKMRSFRAVVWSHHGIIVAGKDLEETFGLIETIEKSAYVHKEIMKLGDGKQNIGSHNLKALANAFKISINEEFLL
ncbi:MAG: rhamnulose-1-phosphate aldolase [Brevinema sp.]